MQRLEIIYGGKGVRNPAGRLYVPAKIAMHIPLDACFECELTPAGVLFRYVGIQPPRPVWANRRDGESRP
jgi:hypothetical protein